MAISGKGNLSIKKKDLQTQRNVAVGIKKLVAYHKATLGDSSIDLNNLNLPSAEMPTATNPTAAELQKAKLFFNKHNLTLISSSKGVLMEHLAYTISSSTLISFEGWTAEDGEIFTLIIDPVAKSGLRTVDASSITATGTLAANTTDFNVGVPFELYKYPNDQVGAVLVFLDGIQQFRNVGNATANPSADGDYEEVDNGGTTSILIRFNNTSASDRDVLVVSNGVLVDRPDDSRDAIIETQQATIDQVVEDLAVVTGNPESRYQAAPSQADLKQFGNRVFNLEDKVIAQYAWTGNQAITSNTTTILNPSTKIYDTHNAVTTGSSWVFTAPKDGYYEVNYRLELTSATTAGHNMEFLVEGSPISNFRRFTSAGMWEVIESSSVICQRNKGETIRFKVYFNGVTTGIQGNVSSVLANGPVSWVSIKEIR